jgi:5-enolpyruvylshikimate-3-phosphate synthase
MDTEETINNYLLSFDFSLICEAMENLGFNVDNWIEFEDSLKTYTVTYKKKITDEIEKICF